jgi:hypothetical protein
VPVNIPIGLLIGRYERFLSSDFVLILRWQKRVRSKPGEDKAGMLRLLPLNL